MEIVRWQVPSTSQVENSLNEIHMLETIFAQLFKGNYGPLVVIIKIMTLSNIVDRRTVHLLLMKLDAHRLNLRKLMVEIPKQVCYKILGYPG